MRLLQSVALQVRWAITAVLVFLIVGLSVTPDHSQPDDSIFAWLIFNANSIFQKFMHFVAYLVLAACVYWSLQVIRSRRLRILCCLTATISLGVFLEWYQTMIPGRFGSLFDVIVNTLGAVAGLILAVVFL